MSKNKCKRCDGTGYLVYTKVIKDGNREMKYQYGCICPCRTASKYEGWTVSEHKSEYYTPYAEEVGL